MEQTNTPAPAPLNEIGTDELIKEHRQLKLWKKNADARENALRDELMLRFFQYKEPQPQHLKGKAQHTTEDGVQYKLEFEQKLDQAVDISQYEVVMAEIGADQKLRETLFRAKYELAAVPYKSLTEAQRGVVDRMLTTKAKRATLDIEVISA